MTNEAHPPAWLLIDTCGETASVALGREGVVVCLEELPRQRASAGVIAAIGRLLEAAAYSLGDLEGVGVVSGPGSFTGVRTGLSVAKGLCEAASLRLYMVSRLEVLAHTAGLEDGYAVLDAGRGEVYVRAVRESSESICSDAALLQRAQGARVVVAETTLMERLSALQPTLHALNAGDALALVTAPASHAVDVAMADAHYLREESAIYKPAAGDGGR